MEVQFIGGGISAQIKIKQWDRMYMKKFEADKKYKQIGIVAVGADSLEDEEYELISRQFRCICNYIGWDLVIDKSISAYAKTDLLNNKEVVEWFKRSLEKYKIIES